MALHSGTDASASSCASVHAAGYMPLRKDTPNTRFCITRTPKIKLKSEKINTSLFLILKNDKLQNAFAYCLQPNFCLLFHIHRYGKGSFTLH